MALFPPERTPRLTTRRRVQVAPLLEAQKENPSLWPESHNQWIASRIDTKVLPAQTYPIMVNINFGIVAKETSMDPLSEDDEEQEWDSAFDMSSEAAQSFMLETCDALTSAQGLVRMVRSCWLYDFRSYVSSQYSGGSVSGDGADYCDGGSPIGFPVPQDRFRDALRCFREQRGGNIFDLGGDKSIDLDASGNVRYSRFQVWSKITGGESIAEMLEIYDDWELWMAERNEEARASPATSMLDKGFQLDANGKFLEMSTIDSLQSGFATAATLSVSLACVAILLTTLNAIVTLYAILTVIGIVLSMLTLMVAGGFMLGVLESMCLAILVGVSIDYTLHLALSYQETDANLPRAERATTAVRHMGISVVSGAVSTASSGILLFFTTITFFTLFGYFIVTTAFLSVVFALFFFNSLLFTLGPEGPAGSLTAGTKCIRGRTPETKTLVVAQAATDSTPETAALTTAKADDPPPQPQPAAEAEPGKSGSRTVFVASSVAIVVVGIIVRFVVSAKEEAATVCEPGFIDLTFPEHAVSSEQTSYMCVGLDLPKECTYHATRLEVLNRVPEMHHVLLMKAVSNLGSCPFTCFVSTNAQPSTPLHICLTRSFCQQDMPEVTGFVWGWAVGGNPLDIPDGMAASLGGTSDAPAVLLQIHYDNPLQKTEVVDPGSGIRVHYTTTPPTQTVSVMGIGAAPIANWEIPPQ